MATKLLVVDDESYLTQLLSHTLRHAGFVVSTAQNGEQAYVLACKELPDLIVSDFQMPVLDGMGLAMRLKETIATSLIPIIMLTARGHQIAPEQIAKTNVCNLLAKPFSLRALKASIGEALGAAATVAASSDQTR
jgi:DNA-binding response OmpR family regulator